MSRSIHTTRRSAEALLEDSCKKKFSNAQARFAAYAKAHKQLRRKRLIKQQVTTERKKNTPPLQGTAISTIPIEVLDEGPFVFHGASPDDLRAILAALPQGASEGISRIHLELGEATIEEQREEDGNVCDPHVGRISHELLPGVYAGDTLGAFHRHSGLISVYAHVYDPGRLPLPKKACAVYLRFHAFRTFVHEVAHHHDQAQRIGRGRWLKDRKENVEWYAEQMEHQWTRSVVVPYLERAYPDEVSEFLNWVEHWGGIRLPLKFFAGDSRRTERNGLERVFWSIAGAFRDWVESLPECQTQEDAWFLFAKEIHYAEEYETSLKILDRLLAQNSEDTRTLAAKAHVLVHLERYDEALPTAQKCLALDKANSDAWEACADVMEARQDWKALLETCSLWESNVSSEELHEREWVPMYRAVAFCGLGDFSEMEKAISTHLEGSIRKPKTTEQAERRKLAAWKSIFRRAGKPMPSHLGGGAAK